MYCKLRHNHKQQQAYQYSHVATCTSYMYTDSRLNAKVCCVHTHVYMTVWNHYLSALHRLLNGFQAQRAEVRSVGERIWEQVKRVFLRELVKKEQMRSEQETSSEHIIQPTRQRRSMLSFFPRRGRRTRRQGRRPVVGRAPAAEH